MRKYYIIFILLFLPFIIAQTSGDYRDLVVRNFAGGLNMEESPSELALNEAQTFTNFIFKTKELQLREGNRLYNVDTTGVAINTIFKHITSYAWKQKVIGYGDKLFVTDDTVTDFSALFLTYAKGTVKVDSTENIVYGYGTKWKETLGEASGDTFVLNSNKYVIDKVVQDGVLLLTASFAESDADDSTYKIYHSFSSYPKKVITAFDKLYVADRAHPIFEYDTSGASFLAVRDTGSTDTLRYDTDTLFIIDTTKSWTADDLIGDYLLLSSMASVDTLFKTDSIILYPAADTGTNTWTKEPGAASNYYGLVDDARDACDDYTTMLSTTTSGSGWFKLDTLQLTAGRTFIRGDSMYIRQVIRSNAASNTLKSCMSLSALYCEAVLESTVTVPNGSWDTLSHHITPSGFSKWSKDDMNGLFLRLQAPATGGDSVMVTQTWVVLVYTYFDNPTTAKPMCLKIIDNGTETIQTELMSLRYSTANVGEHYVILNQLLTTMVRVDSGETETLVFGSFSSDSVMVLVDKGQSWDSTTFMSGMYRVVFPSLGTDTYPIIGNKMYVLASGADSGIGIPIQLPDYTSHEEYVIYLVDYVKPKYEILWQDRIWLAGDSLNPNRLYASEGNLPKEWLYDNWIDVNPNDGDEITGLYVLHGQLIILKRKHIYKLMGDKWESYRVMLALNRIGSEAPYASTLTGDLLFFLARDGFYLFDGTNALKVSGQLETFIKDTLDWDYIELAVADYFDGHFWMSLPTGSENDRAFIFHPEARAWGQLDFMYTQAFYRNTDPSDSNLFFWGDNDSSRIYVYGQGDYQDNGSSLTATYRSPAFDCGNPFCQKRYRTFQFQYAKNDACTLLVDYYRNDSTTSIDQDSILTDTHSGYRIGRMNIKPDLMGKSLTIKIQVLSGDHEVRIPFFRFDWALKPNPRGEGCQDW